MKSKIFIVILLILLVINIPMVNTTWQYADIIKPIEIQIPIHLGKFAYLPQDVLGPNSPHTQVLDTIVDGKGWESSLNYPSGFHGDSIIIRRLKDLNGIIYDRQKVNLFGISGYLTFADMYTKNQPIYYVIEQLEPSPKVGEATKIAFYSIDKPVIDNAKIGDNVLVYKTIIEKMTDGWKCTETFVGTANVIEVKIGKQQPFNSIDIKTWKIQ